MIEMERLEVRRLLAASAVNDSSTPSNLFDASGTLFFAADDGVHGSELWKSDGTESGTVWLGANSAIGPVGSTPHDFVTVGRELYYLGTSEANFPQLFKYDLDGPNFQLIKDFSAI